MQAFFAVYSVFFMTPQASIHAACRNSCAKHNSCAARRNSFGTPGTLHSADASLHGQIARRCTASSTAYHRPLRRYTNRLRAYRRPLQSVVQDLGQLCPKGAHVCVIVCRGRRPRRPVKFRAIPASGTICSSGMNWLRKRIARTKSLPLEGKVAQRERSRMRWYELAAP